MDNLYAEIQSSLKLSDAFDAWMIPQSKHVVMKGVKLLTELTIG
jgi:hypothetical protein